MAATTEANSITRPDLKNETLKTFHRCWSSEFPLSGSPLHPRTEKGRSRHRCRIQDSEDQKGLEVVAIILACVVQKCIMGPDHALPPVDCRTAPTSRTIRQFSARRRREIDIPLVHPIFSDAGNYESERLFSGRTRHARSLGTPYRGLGNSCCPYLLHNNPYVSCVPTSTGVGDSSHPEI